MFIYSSAYICTHMEAEKFLTREEFDMLLHVADARETCLLYMLAGAGMRIGEAVAARIEHINYDQCYMHIPKQNAKGKHARTIVLMHEVIDALHAHIGNATTGWIFPSYAGTHIGSRQAQYIVDAIAHKAGIRHIHPHLLRHSFAVWALDHGISIYDLQKQLGHASIQTTAIYLEVSPGHRRDSFMRSGMLSG